ncbi:MAG: thrombospondin type 3 repeat-containing protein [Verrucomicrobia bacterium]|nr:thrombospondin type 3 repeat-containing protein [Verrucomicrobiota bacterium]
MVELVHDSGVWKDPANAAVVNVGDMASVSLKPCVPVAGARIWGIDSNGNAADTNLNYTGTPLTVQVGPGQSVYVEFTFLPVKLLSWLQFYYPVASDYTALADSDTDGDGMTAGAEYLAGTNPTNRASALRIVGYRHGAGTSTLSWLGVTNRLYAVWHSTNLLNGWTLLTNGVWGLPSGTNYLEFAEPSDSTKFYRVRVSIPP